jgi:hypothetical protein
MHWMLFKQEATGDHYLWNGINPICVHSTDDRLPLIPDVDAQETKLLNDAATTPRKKTLVLRKARYSIIAKGEFTEA